MKNTLSQFIRWNIIALRLNQSYKLNIYFLFILFICIISSIIFRSNLINLFDISSPIIIQLLIIFSIIYSFKLMSDLIIRIIQAFNIIPEFISQYKNKMINIKSIITLYYLQNIFFIALFIWILYIIFTKLNMFIDGIYLFIICFGIIGSINFYYAFPNLFKFNLSQPELHNYSMFVYLLFILFIVFYTFIFPLCIIKIVNSDKFITYFETLNNKLINDFIKNTFNYMSSSSSTGGTGSRSIIRDNNTVDNSGNILLIPESDQMEVSGNNSVINSHNRIEVVPRVTTSGPITTTNNYTQVNVQSVETSSPPAGRNLQSNNPFVAMGHPLNRTRSDYFNSLPNRGVSRAVMPTSQLQIPASEALKYKLSSMSLGLPNLGNSQTSLSDNIIDEIEKAQSVNNSNVAVDGLIDNITSSSDLKKGSSNKGFSVNNLRKFKSAFDLSKLFTHKPSTPKFTTFDFPIATNVENIFKTNKYYNLLQASNELTEYLRENVWLLDNSKDDGSVLTCLSKINNDLFLFSNIQENLINIIDYKKDPKTIFGESDFNTIITLINKYNFDFYTNNKHESYNTEFNTDLFKQLNGIFGIKLFANHDINHFNLMKLKEFYVINDLEYLNAKNNNRFLNIELINNIYHLKNIMNNVINDLIHYPTIKNSPEFYKFNSLHSKFLIKFNSFYNITTLNNIEFKYNKTVNFKSIDNLKKTRLIEYYSQLFNKHNPN